MNVLALDLSLTATGWARAVSDYGTLRPPKGQDRGLPRLAWIRDAVLEVAEGTDVAVVEGYAYALWLFELARHALDLPGAIELPKTHRAALDPERWTHITGADRPGAPEPMQTSLLGGTKT